MKTLYARHKWMQIVFGLLFAAAGVVIIIVALNNKEYISKVLSIAYAVALFLFGATCIFSGVFSLRDKYFDPAFIYGALSIAIGVVLCTNSEMISQFIVVFVGTILVTFGVVYLGEATSMIFFKRPKFFIAMFFVLGAAFVTMGVLTYCFQVEAEIVVYVAVGAISCLVGLIQIVFGTWATLKMAKVRKDINEQQAKFSPEAIEVKNPENPEVIDAKVNDNNNNGSTDA